VVVIVFSVQEDGDVVIVDNVYPRACATIVSPHLHLWLGAWWRMDEI
jgi:hypothetical protein